MPQEHVRCFSKTDHMLFAYIPGKGTIIWFIMMRTRGGQVASGNCNKSLILLSYSVTWLLSYSVTQLLSCRLPQQTYSLTVASETLPGNAPDYG